MFLQSCFIRKDNQELRDRLKRIGLQPHPCIMPKSSEYLFVNRGFYSRDEIGYQEEIERAVDCGTNERLFLAIAAIRNDTDQYQLFVNNNNGEFFKCYENEFSHFRFDTNDILNIANAIENGSSLCFGKPLVPYEDTKNWHKATVEELIEHFKYK